MERKHSGVIIITRYYIGPDGYVYTERVPASIALARPDASRDTNEQHYRGGTVRRVHLRDDRQPERH